MTCSIQSNSLSLSSLLFLPDHGAILTCSLEDTQDEIDMDKMHTQKLIIHVDRCHSENKENIDIFLTNETLEKEKSFINFHQP